MVILFFAFTIIPVLIALIVPTSTEEKKSSSLGLVFVVVILGILAAVAIPKFTAANAKIQHEQVVEQMPSSTTDKTIPRSK